MGLKHSAQNETCQHQYHSKVIRLLPATRKLHSLQLLRILRDPKFLRTMQIRNEKLTGAHIRRLNNENTFKSETKKYFYDRALARFSQIYHYHFAAYICLSSILGDYFNFDASQYLILVPFMPFYIANLVVFNRCFQFQFSVNIAQFN